MLQFAQSFIVTSHESNVFPSLHPLCSVDHATGTNTNAGSAKIRLRCKHKASVTLYDVKPGEMNHKSISPVFFSPCNLSLSLSPPASLLTRHICSTNMKPWKLTWPPAWTPEKFAEIWVDHPFQGCWYAVQIPFHCCLVVLDLFSCREGQLNDGTW